MFPFTSSSDDVLKKASVKALSDLAGPDDQEKLIELLSTNENPEYINDIQNAVAIAANKTPEPDKRAAMVLHAMLDNNKDKIIPILSKIGGSDALSTVLKEFENGNSDIRDVCFKTLTRWKDYSASSALYEICASGNKTFEETSFSRICKTNRIG